MGFNSAPNIDPKDDIEKARKMAYASNKHRSAEAENREHGDMPEAGMSGQIAESIEERESFIYDEEKNIKGLNDRQLDQLLMDSKLALFDLYNVGRTIDLEDSVIKNDYASRSVELRPNPGKEQEARKLMTVMALIRKEQKTRGVEDLSQGIKDKMQ